MGAIFEISPLWWLAFLIRPTAASQKYPKDEPNA